MRRRKMGEFATVSDAKDFFRQVRKEQAEIRHLQEMIKDIEISFLPQAIRYDKDKVQQSPKDTMMERAAIVSDYQRQLNESLYKFMNKATRAEKLIMSLESTDERDIMRLYYMETMVISDSKKRINYTWEDVASEKSMDKRWVLRLHGRALFNMTK
jgi:hypothetical protein